MHLFLTDTIDPDYVTLSPEESHHCVKVLRMGVGDSLYVTDGRGTMCHAEVSTPDARACQVRIIERQPNYQQRPFHLHIAVAPTKNNARIEWFLEKAVEIGVDEFTPIICDHSERCILKADRLDKIVVSAMKQSLKAYKPVVHDPIRLSQFLSNLNSSSPRHAEFISASPTLDSPRHAEFISASPTADSPRHAEFISASPSPDLQPMPPVHNSEFKIQNSKLDLLMCYCDGDERHSLSERYHPGHDVVILIGPEGDFSPTEIQTAFSAGFQPITLGPCRLRTETAALYAITALNFLNS